MKAQPSPVLLLLAAVCMFLVVTQVDADCCRYTWHQCGWWRCYYKCADGNYLRPNDVCCGVGPCNIFCCNCEGGCKEKSLFGQTNQIGRELKTDRRLLRGSMLLLAKMSDMLKERRSITTAEQQGK